MAETYQEIALALATAVLSRLGIGDLCPPETPKGAVTTMGRSVGEFYATILEEVRKAG